MTAAKINYSVELLFRRKRVFCETAGMVLLVVVLATFLWPPVYESDAKILVQDNRAQLLVSPDLQRMGPGSGILHGADSVQNDDPTCAEVP